MTTATINKTTFAAPSSLEPERDIIAWLLASEPAVEAAPAPQQKEAGAATSSVATPDAGAHDMTPEYIAWVMGTGYAAGHLPHNIRGASSP